MAGWTARALAELIGIPPATLTTWINGGLVKPERFGRGRAGHVIGVGGLLEVVAVAELRSVGFSLPAVRIAVENLRMMSGESRPLTQLTLVVNGNDIAWEIASEVEKKQISVLRKPGQRLMVFPVGEAHACYLEQLTAQPKEAFMSVA